MRTLKKTLALVLVLAMMFSLCVTASADFTDADEITYVEAAEVLNAIGVIEGMPDGSFDAKGTLTRAQAATMIVRLLDAEDLATAAVASFDDVAANHWAAAAIAYCAEEGIIAGYGDGNFGPSDALTGYAWAKMLLVALGSEEEYTGAAWQIAVAKDAADYGLFGGNLKGDKTVAATREEAALYALNALNYSATPAVWNVVDEDGKVIGKFDTQIEAVMYNKLLDNEYTVKKAGAEDSLLKTVHGITKEGDVDAFGRPGTAYHNAKYTTYLYYQDAPVLTYDGNFTKKVADALVKDEYTFSGVLYNGGIDTDVDEIAELYAPADAKGAGVTGYHIEMYASNPAAPKAIDTIVVTEGYMAVVGKTTAAKGEIPASLKLTVYDEGLGGEYKKEIKVIDDVKNPADAYDMLSAYAEKDVLVVYCMPGWDTAGDDAVDYVLDAYAASSVAGKITKVNVGLYNCTTSIVIDGTTYKLNNECVGGKSLQAGAEGTLYLDDLGNGIGWAKKVDAVTDKAVAIKDVYTSLVDGKLVTNVEGILSDGSTATMTVKAEATIPEEFGVYEYTLDLLTGTYTFAAIDNTTVADGKTIKAEDKTIGDTTKTFDTGLYFADGVKFIFVDSTVPGTITVKDGIQKITEKDTYATIKTVAGVDYVTAVYVMSAPTDGNVATDDIIYVAAQTGTQSILVGKETKTVYTYAAFVNGVAVEDFYSETPSVTGFYKSVKNEKTGAYVLTETTAYKTTGKLGVDTVSVSTYAAGIVNGDYDVAAATIVDLTLTQVGMTEAKTIAVMYNTDNYNASYVYILE